eukprot:CCRYP_003699-RA/>CCRYP_003699-RA protein AED:0.11 eAED:0.11 QI:0/-1/0/1/-1/1/1/0/453
MQHQSILGECAVPSPGFDFPLVKDGVNPQLDIKDVKTGDAPSKVSNSGENVDELSETDCEAINSIISQLSSWMDAKRQRESNIRNQKSFEEKPHTYCRPFVTLAYAQTLDGMIAARVASRDYIDEQQTTSNLKLSCPQSFVLTHRLRNMHDAIMVGGSTFLLDAPRLNVRVSSKITRESMIEQQPIPVVLDTHLHSLQKLLWGKVIQNSSDGEEYRDHWMPKDMFPENIRAQNPVICCSSDAARLFLDYLELFQQQQTPLKKVDELPGQLNRQQKRVYVVTVYKMVDERNDHEGDLFLPIKISIQTTHDGRNRQKETLAQSDTTTTTTFTLLPCQIHKNCKMLDLEYTLGQLNKQLQIESVMVEGGASVLSSFLNKCLSANDGKTAENRFVDCVCATISASLIGMRGLPVFGEFDIFRGQDPDESTSEYPNPLVLRDGRFVTLGRDSIFLGRL